MSLRRILVPLDGSLVAETGLTFALMLPSTVVQLLTVVTPPGDRGLSSDGAASSYLSEVAGRLKYRGIAIETTVAEGDPTAAIASNAENDDLVVMTSSGSGGAHTGSTAHAVADQSPVPVMLLRVTPPDTTDPMIVRLLLAVDGSGNVERRAAVCGALAADLGLRVKIISTAQTGADTELAVQILRRYDVQTEVVTVEDASPSALATIGRQHEVIVVEAADDDPRRKSALHRLMDDCVGPVLIVPTRG